MSYTVTQGDPNVYYTSGGNTTAYYMGANTASAPTPTNSTSTGYGTATVYQGDTNVYYDANGKIDAYSGLSNPAVNPVISAINYAPPPQQAQQVYYPSQTYTSTYSGGGGGTNSSTTRTRAPTTTRPATLAPIRSSLKPGQYLSPGQALTSPNRMYSAKYSTNGDLCIYQANVATPTWCLRNNLGDEPVKRSWGSIQGSRFYLMSNGELVAISKTRGFYLWEHVTAKVSNATYWKSGKGRGNTLLTMQDDGKLALYKKDVLVWSMPPPATTQPATTQPATTQPATTPAATTPAPTVLPTTAAPTATPSPSPQPTCPAFQQGEIVRDPSTGKVYGARDGILHLFPTYAIYQSWGSPRISREVSTAACAKGPNIAARQTAAPTFAPTTTPAPTPSPTTGAPITRPPVPPPAYVQYPNLVVLVSEKEWMNKGVLKVVTVRGSSASLQDFVFKDFTQTFAIGQDGQVRAIAGSGQQLNVSATCTGVIGSAAGRRWKFFPRPLPRSYAIEADCSGLSRRRIEFDDLKHPWALHLTQSTGSGAGWFVVPVARVE